MKPSPFTLTDILGRENLTRIADTTTFDRGEAYFHQRAVSNLVIGTDEIRAEVQGSRTYEVALRRSKRLGLTYGCSCPVGRDGRMCKHVVATALAAVQRSGTSSAAASATSAATSPARAEPTAAVTLVLALLWTHRTRAVVYQVLAALRWTRTDGRSYTQDDVRNAIRQLKADGAIDEMPRRDGYFRLTDEVRTRAYRELLRDHRLLELRNALRGYESPAHAYIPRWLPTAMEDVIAVVRLELLGGAGSQELTRLRDSYHHSVDWAYVIREAVFAAFDRELFERVNEDWRWSIATMALAEANDSWSPAGMALCEWVMSLSPSACTAMPEPVKLVFAEFLLHRGERDRMHELLSAIDSGAANALRAGALVQQGQWADAQSAFEAAFERRKKEVKARKRILPASLAWLYPVALLAQGTPAHLEAAYKFCIGESGQREPSPYGGWGLFVNAAGSRLGRSKLVPEAFGLHQHGYGLDALWRLLLAAWLGRDALPREHAGSALVREQAVAIRGQCARCGFTALVAQVDAAETVLQGGKSPSWFVASGAVEPWRAALTALLSLTTGEPGHDPDERATRLLWEISIRKNGGIGSIRPLEQRRGARGWGKPKQIPLSRIANDQTLPPADAKVARAIRQVGYSTRDLRIDSAAAIVALIGHPGVVLSDGLEQHVDLVEGTPEVEVVRRDGHYVVRMTPQLPGHFSSDDPGDEDNEFDADYDPMRRPGTRETAPPIVLIRDSSVRVRVIRFSAAQQRASQVIGACLEVPAEGAVDLTQALRALAGHFDVHADEAQAARQVEAEARLRAELRPVGPNLRLRLVVAPLGAGGPRVTPGRGRARLMASIDGETVGVQRDLAAEQANLRSVLDALPDLDQDDAAVVECEWLLDDPEVALGVVEALPQLPAVAVVEWPSGKAVRLYTLDVPQLSVTVRTGRDWFGVEGGIVIDDGVALDVAALLEASRSRSRFIPLGEGRYAALTQSLRERLADIAAIAEVDKRTAQVPKLAGAWLADAIDGATVKNDSAFSDVIGRLRRAQDETFVVPPALQAELRPYQVDGYQWAMRLAAADLGGCLADDMGLGKTLQGLAVLLARAAGGAALIIAPTSVCGNWQREALRFAPTLNVTIYGEAEREAVVTAAGAHDVIVVSYTQVQLARERFASRRWHTVIADEAQAIKNATAKRSLAVFDLDADFRLAMTGTPVENRLAELWSIMRFANPGLLGTPARFDQRFALPIERNQDRGARHTLKRLLSPFILRRTKSQVLDDLPPRTELLIALAQDATQAAHYEALRQQALANATTALESSSGQARINVLAQLMRLRRAACDPRLVTPEFPGTGSKVQAVVDLAVELKANGHKALVFSQFVDFLSLLRPPLEAAGIGYQYLDGSTPAAERTRRVEAFQAGNGELFLISLKAGGFGLNLTAADYVLITDPWWNPAAEDQAMGRAHRIGQKRPVTVYRLVTKNTVEEKIVSLHHEKRALADSILAGTEVAILPSAEELIDLMRG